MICAAKSKKGRGRHVSSNSNRAINIQVRHTSRRPGPCPWSHDFFFGDSFAQQPSSWRREAELVEARPTMGHSIPAFAGMAPGGLFVVLGDWSRVLPVAELHYNQLLILFVAVFDTHPLRPSSSANHARCVFTVRAPPLLKISAPAFLARKKSLAGLD